MARKILLVVASLTLIVAGTALYFTVSNANAASSSTATVFVSSGDLGPGTLGSGLTDVQVQQVQVPKDLVPPNALTNLAQVANLQTSVPVFKGQILMARMFSPTAATGGLVIPPGSNAITVSLTDPGRVAGFVQPGSKVVIYQTASSTTSGGVVLREAKVIAVGPTTTTGKAGTGAVSNSAVPTALITFALSPVDSVKVVGRDDLYLGLLPS